MPLNEQHLVKLKQLTICSLATSQVRTFLTCLSSRVIKQGAAA